MDFNREIIQQVSSANVILSFDQMLINVMDSNIRYYSY